jgi:hypothetical protein
MQINARIRMSRPLEISLSRSKRCRLKWQSSSSRSPDIKWPRNSSAAGVALSRTHIHPKSSGTTSSERPAPADSPYLSMAFLIVTTSLSMESCLLRSHDLPSKASSKFSGNGLKHDFVVGRFSFVLAGMVISSARQTATAARRTSTGKTQWELAPQVAAIRIPPDRGRAAVGCRVEAT